MRNIMTLYDDPFSGEYYRTGFDSDGNVSVSFKLIKKSKR